MECVLRIWGSNLIISDAETLISVTPYRIDRRGENNAKLNCLYYEVVRQHDGVFSEMLNQVLGWLTKTQGIAEVKNRNDVDQINLDIAVFITEDMISSSYTVDTNFLQVASDLGLSITISVYKNESDDRGVY